MNYRAERPGYDIIAVYIWKSVISRRTMLLVVGLT